MKKKNVPVFEFVETNISQEDYLKEEEKLNSGFKGIDPGTYDLKIMNAEFSTSTNNPSIWCENDNTWFKVKLTLGIEDRTINTWMVVPTKKILFNEENSKAPLFVFTKFRTFMAALGEDVAPKKESLAKIVPKYFKDPKKLVGKTLKVTIAYTAAHAIEASKGQFLLYNSLNKCVSDEVFSTRQECEAEAASMKLPYNGYPEVTEYFSKLATTKKVKSIAKKEIVIEETDIEDMPLEDVPF